MPFHCPSLSSQYHRPHHRYVVPNLDEEELMLRGKHENEEESKHRASAGTSDSRTTGDANDCSAPKRHMAESCGEGHLPAVSSLLFAVADRGCVSSDTAYHRSKRTGYTQGDQEPSDGRSGNAELNITIPSILVIGVVVTFAGHTEILSGRHSKFITTKRQPRSIALEQTLTPYSQDQKVQSSVSPSRTRSSALVCGSESQFGVEEERETARSSSTAPVWYNDTTDIAPIATSRPVRSPLELERATFTRISGSSKVDHKTLDLPLGAGPPLINKSIAMCDMTSSQQQGLDEVEKTGMKEENQKKEENEKEQNEEEKEERKGIDTEMVSSRQALGGSTSMLPDASEANSRTTKMVGLASGSKNTGTGIHTSTSLQDDAVSPSSGKEREQVTSMEVDGDQNEDEQRLRWSPTLPIHALTCDDQMEGRQMMNMEDPRMKLADDEGSQEVKEIEDTKRDTALADNMGVGSRRQEVEARSHEEKIPLVPPPQGSMLAKLLRPETRPAQPPILNTAANTVSSSSTPSASTLTTSLPTSTTSPPRPFLPLQPAGSLFERRILPPPRAPHAPPFERRATVGSDLLSDTRRDPWDLLNVTRPLCQPPGALFGNYEIAPLTPGNGEMMPMDLDPGASTGSWDRPRPTSSPGPRGGPVQREPHRRRGSVHLPGLSNSNPARPYGSLSNLADTRTLGDHRRRSSAEQRVHAFSPYRGAGAGAAVGARSRALTGSRQTMSPGSEMEDPFQQVGLPVAGPNGHRPSVLESRLPGGSEETDEPGRRPNLAGKSVKSTRMGMACIICRKRKIKCSGDQPCEECARHDRVCQYRPIPVEESRAERERRSRRARRSSEREV
ncbi:hypothetical protein FFLO_02647 [Filobasidium floriforme]|uniref:Zn(2)-C6 fungal-type domain-containing protein n=1 Tax=Filobasidium floriforme TaxID=5210 RepID=A0A8K0NNY6_9TREE|nr:uncharacterized protein HD553DRAFT_359911 [Filobasidium floriforme]KAG7561918.1 hypothetical protein FFLO_02647 [Filobasidium floriforme]KAH8089399.1 hypothetical protein HD553DRAFT_359911 [Filobasidium floriforme]